MKKFDAIIIGAGQGGIPLARKLAAAGWTTALIEKRWIGGTCINDGCTPSKAMIACAQAAYTVANSWQWGVDISGFRVDLAKVVDRKQQIVQSFRSGAEKGLQDTKGLTLFYGDASFSAYKTLDIRLNDGGSEVLMADKIFINTGGQPQIPDIPGLDAIPYFTSTTLLDARAIPPHLLVLGGSYIGLEMGQMFRRFGSQVTVIEMGPRLLPHEDEDVSDAVRKILEEEGMEFITGAKAQKIERSGETLELELAVGEQFLTVMGSHLLLAAGRTPQTASLGLELTSVEKDEKGYIRVNNRLETNVPGIYALGDVKGGPAFTHISYNDHLVLARNLLKHENASIDDRPVPYCMFTDPQLGRIGLTEKAAREKGHNIKVACLGMDRVARSIETGHVKGFMKAVVDADTGGILGAAILGAEGGEVMSMLQLAMLGGITAPQLAEMIFAHPLYAESLNNLFMTLESTM